MMSLNVKQGNLWKINIASVVHKLPWGLIVQDTCIYSGSFYHLSNQNFVDLNRCSLCRKSEPQMRWYFILNQ